VKAGCDLSSPASINQFLKDSHRKRNAAPTAEPGTSSYGQPESDLLPLGKRGAVWALQRLEQAEERAFARLTRAIEYGNEFQIKSAQEFYLRCSETLRRLDLSIETERRNAEEQVPMREVESVAAQISTWLRLSFERFLSAESPGLMSIKDLGEFKFSAIERFRGILHATVKASIRSDPLILDWAAAKVIEAWNVPGF
jgi:hypothetical protein